MMRLGARRGIVLLTKRRNHQGSTTSVSFLPPPQQQHHSEIHRHFSTNRDGGPRSYVRNSNQKTGALTRDRDNRQQKNDSGKTKVKELDQQMQTLRQQLFQLPPIPSAWSLQQVGSSNSNLKIDVGYKTLVDDARAFLDQLEQAIYQGQLNHRFSTNISRLLQQSLKLFRTSYADCLRVMSLANKLNLNIANQRSVLEAACMEGRWREASKLFSKLIDPDLAGFMPMEIIVGEPIGLYAIARDAQLRNIPVAEQVMDAVMSMSMVNPTDQNKYVLAAGAALGRIGAWKELVDFQANSFNSARLGQSLIGAVMYACIVNDRQEDAVKQFVKLFQGGGVRSEWQWSGGADMIDPIVRDIAMRAGGPKSIELFKQAIDEGFQVSFQALRAVVGSCSGSIDLVSIIDHLSRGTSWLVDGDALSLVRCEEQDRPFEIPPEQLETIVLAMIRRCNHAGEFGLSLLLYDMIAPSDQDRLENWQHDFVRRISGCKHRDETLAAIMTALCGLESAGIACSLYENAAEGNSDHFPFSSDLYQYAKSIATGSDRWHSVQEKLYRLVHAIRNLPATSLTSRQTDTLLAALAKAAEACNSIGQPDAAICLMRCVQKKALSLQKVEPTMGGAVRSFLGIEEDEIPEHTILARSDALLAQSIRAHRLRKLPKQALSMFETVRKESSSSYESFPLSVHQALEVLIDDGHLGQAMELFQSLDQCAWTPDIFVCLITGLEREQRWSAIGDLYHLSLKSGCLTEYVGVMAMKAVVHSPEFDGKIRILRGIVKETSTFIGMVENEWQYTRYWWLKGCLGIRYSRLLMWWNEPRTSDLFELQLAIAQLTEAQAAGLRPKFDVLRSIVRHCRHYPRLAPLIPECNVSLPVEKQAWADLLAQVIVAVQTVPQRNDESFIEEIIKALRTVEAHSVCDEFAFAAQTRGVRLDKAFLKNDKVK